MILKSLGYDFLIVARAYGRAEMQDELQAAEEYLARAEEVRARLAEVTDPKIRATMLDIAAEYERMAGAMIRIHQSRTAIERLSTPPKRRLPPASRKA